jgi:hypothetical protein
VLVDLQPLELDLHRFNRFMPPTRPTHTGEDKRSTILYHGWNLSVRGVIYAQGGTCPSAIVMCAPVSLDYRAGQLEECVDGLATDIWSWSAFHSPATGA